jgi:peptidyl-prolyl cis-trans isomerase SurA
MNMFRVSLILLFALLLTQPIVAAQTSLDSIVAVVDESVITERELAERIKLVSIEFNQSNRRLPKKEVLHRQVLEVLINASLLLQEADRRGIKITDGQLNQSMQRLARQNKLSLSDFRKALIRDGLNYDNYRETLRMEMTISTLGRQYSQRNATISDAEVDNFIKASGGDNTNYEYRISHILIALPDAAQPEEVSEAQEMAEEILAELNQGAEFDQLANKFSTGDTALQGGALGWRKKAEIPSLFTTQVLSMEMGDYAGPIRSANGFHIIHLDELRDLEQSISQQTRSSHILIKPNELVTEDDARNRLYGFRERILQGEEFARLARLYSVDYTSATEGGDIGWQDPGSTVKDYEAVTDRLEIGELSEPTRTQFGWHLIEVTDRRTVDETEQNKRNNIYSQLLQQKQREVFDLWKRRLRDEAFVVVHDEPDA